MSLRAASSLRKCPFLLIALRSCRFNASIAFVVYTTRRSSGGKPGSGRPMCRRRPRARPGRRRRPMAVYRLQLAGDLLALPPRHVLEAVPDQVDDAGLHDRGRVDRLDRFREALQPVDAAEQDVGEAALLELAHDLHPELRALRLLDPHPEHVPLALDRDA